MDIYNYLMYPHEITYTLTTYYHIYNIITHVIHYLALVQPEACFADTHIFPQNLIQCCNAQHTFMFKTHRLNLDTEAMGTKITS